MARNPFETALTSTGSQVDQMREPPMDLMADAFISEIVNRMSRGRRHGYIPGLVPSYRGNGRDYEHNGLPLGPGLHMTHDTYPDIAGGARINPFGLGGRDQMSFYHGNRQLDLGPPMSSPMPYEETYDNYAPDLFGDGDIGEGDPFAPQFDSMGQFDLDTAFAGVDGVGDMNPFPLPPQPRLPTVAEYAPDPGLANLRRAIRPGYAELATYGYSEPNTDPYAENLTALLRRLVRQA